MSDRPSEPAVTEASPARPIVVFVHVHYPDVWEEMAPLLAERLEVPFRLVITSSLPTDDFAVPETSFHRETIVVRAENRGRDIRPFLVALRRIEDFDIGLKLHTKRSVHLLDGNDWREEILSSLVPPRPGVDAICRAFAVHDRIGLLAPRGQLIPIRDWILRNWRRMKRIAAVFDADLDPGTFDEGYFAAGSMFWFRREALAAFADEALPPLFEAERGQVDGTAAHAIERLFALKAERDGFIALPMNAVNALHDKMSDAELRQLSRTSAEVVSPFFRKPRVVRLLARYAPWVLALYRGLPTPMRRRLRDGVVGKREEDGFRPD